MYKQPPARLVDLALYASLMRNGAAAAGGGTLLLEHAVMANLSANAGWPIGSTEYNELREFVTKTLPGFSTDTPRYTIDTMIGRWLDTAQPETVAYLENPARLRELQIALESAHQQLTHDYGDPLQMPAKGMLRASFDAIRNGRFDVNVGKLNAVTQTIATRLQRYENTQDKLEFWVRTFEELKKKDWPFSADPEGTLMNEMTRLVATTPATVADLQGREGNATNFIVYHADDLKAAALTVLAQMDREAKSGLGVNLTHSLARMPRFPN